MTSYHTGFLYMTDYWGNPVEIVNEARTRARMLAEQRANRAPFFGGLSPQPAGICSYLAFDPCLMDPTGAVTSWQAMDTDTNAAPWWTPGDASASNEGLGFWIEEWTGLDGGHHQRSMMPRGNAPYGAAPGLQTQGARVMAINLIAVGQSERGLNHLFRWLEGALLATCSRGDENSLWLREHCPVGSSSTALEDGLVRLDRVVLIAGPTWETPPIEDAGCHLRRISFTLAAGDPCMRRVPGTLNSSFATAATVGPVETPAACDVYSGSSQRQSLAVTAPAYGMTAPMVTITSAAEYSAGTRLQLPPLRIIGFVDKTALGSLKPCAQERIGLITLDDIASGWDVIVDCGTAEISIRDKYGDREWTDGGSILQANFDYDPSFDGRRVINFLNCVGGYVVVEPASSGNSGTVSKWTTTIQMIERFGCSG